MTKTAALAAAVAGVLAAGAGCRPAAPPPAPAAAPAEIAVRDGLLLFRGQPVHPQAFERLSVMIADVLPVAVAVDLDGCRDTEIFEGPPAVSGRRVTCELPGEGGHNGKAYFAYEHLGAAPCGVHALVTYESGGGTAVFTSLLLVRFERDREWEWQEGGGRPRERVLMRRVGEFGLGDRFDGEFRLSGGVLTITGQDHYGRIGQGPKRVRITVRIEPESVSFSDSVVER